MADNDTSTTASHAPSTAATVMATVYGRTFEENMKFIVKDSEYPYLYHIEIGFVPGMRVRLV
jgi:hypothetical protein